MNELMEMIELFEVCDELKVQARMIKEGEPHAPEAEEGKKEEEVVSSLKSAIGAFFKKKEALEIPNFEELITGFCSEEGFTELINRFKSCASEYLSTNDCPNDTFNYDINEFCSTIHDL